MNTSGNRSNWGKLLSAVITPFTPVGSINDNEFQRICAHLVDEQANDGLVIAGTTGESPTLSHSEKIRLLELALEAVGDRASVVFGAGTYDTAETIELTRLGEQRGAHGIMLVSPYYSKPGQAGLLAHFTAAAQSTSLPVMIYNIVGRTAINIETDTLMKLAEIRNVAAVKEASGSIAQISEVCSRAPEGFTVYSGDDGLTLPALAVGASGVISVAGHVCGKEIKAMIDCFASDPATAQKIHHSLMPRIAALFKAPNPVPVKHALSTFGFDCRSVRLPLVPLTDAEAIQLEALFEQPRMAVAAV